MAERIGNWQVEAVADNDNFVQILIDYISTDKKERPIVIDETWLRNVGRVVFVISTRNIEDRIRETDSVSECQDSKSTWQQRGLGKGYWDVKFTLKPDCTLTVSVSNAAELDMRISRQSGGAFLKIEPVYD